MIAADPCPSPDALAAYRSGQLPESELSQLDAHLERCAECASAVDAAAETDDSLIGWLRGAEPASGEDSAYACAADELKGRLGSHSPDLPRGGQIGDYRLVEPLGSGGMGQVYRAVHGRLRRAVAIKLLPNGAAPDGLAKARFEREMRAVGGLDHPHIVQATDAGEVDGTPYLVMQLVDGVDLARLLRLIGTLPSAEACRIIQLAAVALEHAHQRGIIHRDVKPSNLMLTRDGAVKVLDLGLAHLGAAHQSLGTLTATGQLMGTLDYMAPEQARGEGTVDARADVYGLGATLYKLLTGRAPGPAGAADASSFARLQARAAGEPVDWTDVPEPVRPVLEKMLAADPAQRVATAAEAARLLEPLADGARLEGLSRQATRAAEQQREQTGRATTRRTGAASSAAAVPRAGRWSPLRRLLVGAGLAGWLAAAVVIVLETQRGQLVIESEVEGVEVRLLRDGKPYDELTLASDAEAVRLRADRYEILLPTGDHLQVHPDRVEVRRGETVVAKVTERAREAEPSRRTSDARPATESRRSQVLEEIGKKLLQASDREVADRLADGFETILQEESSAIGATTRRLVDQMLQLDAEGDRLFAFDRENGRAAAAKLLSRIIPRDDWISLLRSSSASEQLLGLRIAKEAVGENADGLPAEIAERVVELRQSESPAIQYAAYRVAFSSSDPAESSAVADPNPYIAIAAAEAATEVPLRVVPVDDTTDEAIILADGPRAEKTARAIAERMLEILRAEEDSELLQKAAERLAATPIARRAPSGVAEAIDELAARIDTGRMPPETIDFLLSVQNQLLDALREAGPAAAEALPSLRQELARRYRSAPETLSDASRVPIAGGYSGEYGVSEAVSFTVPPSAPLHVIEAIFAITGDVDAWDEPTGPDTRSHGLTLPAAIRRVRLSTDGPGRAAALIFANWGYPRTVGQALLRAARAGQMADTGRSENWEPSELGQLPQLRSGMGGMDYGMGGMDLSSVGGMGGELEMYGGQESTTRALALHEVLGGPAPIPTGIFYRLTYERFRQAEGSERRFLLRVLKGMPEVTDPEVPRPARALRLQDAHVQRLLASLEGGSALRQASVVYAATLLLRDDPRLVETLGSLARQSDPAVLPHVLECCHWLLDFSGAAARAPLEEAATAAADRLLDQKDVRLQLAAAHYAAKLNLQDAMLMPNLRVLLVSDVTAALHDAGPPGGMSPGGFGRRGGFGMPGGAYEVEYDGSDEGPSAHAQLRVPPGDFVPTETLARNVLLLITDADALTEETQEDAQIALGRIEANEPRQSLLDFVPEALLRRLATVGGEKTNDHE